MNSRSYSHLCDGLVHSAKSPGALRVPGAERSLVSLQLPLEREQPRAGRLEALGVLRADLGEPGARLLAPLLVRHQHVPHALLDRGLRLPDAGFLLRGQRLGRQRVDVLEVRVQLLLEAAEA